MLRGDFSISHKIPSIISDFEVRGDFVFFWREWRALPKRPKFIKFPNKKALLFLAYIENSA
jgi:hypothetical protein